MTDKYEDIRNEVDKYLVSCSVTYFVRYVGETTREAGDRPWECDEWCITLMQGKARFETSYYTGLGYRRMPKHHTRMPNPPYRKGTLAYEQWEKQMKPVAPRAADVLYSLLSDAQAADQSFNDWCADLGFNNDSLKDLGTYQQCCKTAEILRKIFTPAQREKLQTWLQDY